MSSQAIEYFHFQNNESCSEEGCSAQKYYVEDGKKFCLRGHEQAGFTQTQQDEDDGFLSKGITSHKQRHVKEHSPIALKGYEAKELFLKCLQFILWKQCHFLVTVKKLNKELEVIVRNLWRLRVGAVWHDGIDGLSSREETDRPLFSSQGEVGTEKNILEEGSQQKKRSARSDEESPKLIETLSLCYLGILLLRLPIGLGEVLEWAARNEILYLRAVKSIPRLIRAKLPARYYNALELKAPLKGSKLYSSTLDMIEFFNLHYRMVFPPLNAPLLIYKCIKNLGLPVEIYCATQHLKELLGLEFSFPNSKGTRSLLNSYPEIRLISLIIIATKLVHPFDSIIRNPENDICPSFLKLDWEEWMKIMVEKPSEKLRKGEEIYLHDTDVFDMSEIEIDQYLDWFQQIWIDDRVPKLSQRILDLFPLMDDTSLQIEETESERRDFLLKKVQEILLPQDVRPPGKDSPIRVKRPGELYKRYRTIQELNRHAEAFFKLAASNVGISLKLLVKSVFKLEVQLDSWVIRDKKRRMLAKERVPTLEHD